MADNLVATIADPAGPLSYNTLRKKYSGWNAANFEDAIKKVTRPSELDELRVAIKYFLSKEDAIKLSESVSARLNELSDRLISFGDFLMAYKNAELAFKEMRDRCVKRGNDWVCASYMSQIDFFIHSQATDRSKGSRRPLNDMLGKVREGYELVKLLEEKWTEFQDKEQIPGFIEEEIHDLFKGLLAREIGPDRFWASMDIRSEVEGRPIITPAKKMELIELWVKHGIMLPAQKHIAKPEVTMPMPPTAPMEPVSIEELKRVVNREGDIEKRIEELRKKKELERQRQLEKERQEREKETGKPPAKPVQPLPAAPAVSPELDLMKDEIEKRIAEIMRKRRSGEGQAGEPAARYGIKKKELKAPRTTLLEVTGTESKYSAGAGNNQWIKTPVSVSVEQDQYAKYLLYRKGKGKDASTSYHAKTYTNVYMLRYQGAFGYTVELGFTDEKNNAIKVMLDPAPGNIINGFVFENNRKIAEFEVDESSFRKAEQFAREHNTIKEPPETESEQEASCPPHEAPPGFICPKCGEFVPERTEYEPDILPEKSYSYAEMQFRIKTCQDVDTLKKVYALLDTSTDFTEFDKELLKEEIAQRMQDILEHEERGQARRRGEVRGRRGEYELSDEEYTKANNISFDELISHNICPECKHKMKNGKCLLHGSKEQILKHTNIYQKYAIIFDLPSHDISSAQYDIFSQTLSITYGIDKPRRDQKTMRRKATKEFADFFTSPIFTGKPLGDILDLYLKDKTSKTKSIQYSNKDELSIVETNLLNVGYDLRNDGRGHMVLPNGKGVSPTNNRGIVNHWEVIVDAGYLPISNIFKLKHLPSNIIAGAINKGWRRWAGEASYEIRDLSKPNADFINMRLKRYYDNSGLYEAHIDIWSEGKYYNFNKKIWDKSNHDILQVVKKVSPKSYHPAKAMELKLIENEYLIKDPASIGDPDVWIQPKGAAFRDEVIGAHHGQVDGTLFAYDLKTGTTTGYIDYTLYEGELYINIIEVVPAHRRQGYATALVLKLKKLNPGMPVKWGMMTEEGCALKNDIEKGIAEPRHEYTKAERIAMAKAIAATVEKTTSKSEGEICINLDNISNVPKEERIRLAKMIDGGETEVRSTVVRDDALDVKEKCSEWDFGTFEVMLSGAETQDELEGMLDCLNVSKILSESEIDTMRKLIEKKMMEE